MKLPGGPVLHAGRRQPRIQPRSSTRSSWPRLDALRQGDGQENVIAGTDCGMGSRVGHAEVCWAKFKAMSEGAAIASKRLWGK